MATRVYVCCCSVSSASSAWTAAGQMLLFAPDRALDLVARSSKRLLPLANNLPRASSLTLGPLWTRRSRSCGALVSRRGRRRGDDFARDFCSSSSSASWRCPLQRRQEEEECCAGAMAAGFVCLAVGSRVPCSVLGLWSVVGGFGAARRRLRRERLDLEVEGELGDVPRPAGHSDMWALHVLLLVVHKAVLAMEFLLPRVCWLPFSSLVLFAGAGDERWFGAFCTDLRIPLFLFLCTYL